MPKRKPEWLKARIGGGKPFNSVKTVLRNNGLCTVCEEAKCPNIAECWSSRTATFMVLGRVCTRSCGFCAVQSAGKGQPLDTNEPQKIAEAVSSFGLRHAVLTSVDRDDLPDFGAGHFAECIGAVRQTGARVEALIPDFQGSPECLSTILSAGPDVVGHNIEVVESLQAAVRDPRASYAQSISVLGQLKELDQRVLTKSSLMLGLGETRDEVLLAMDDLRAVGCDFLTLGQYLQPSLEKLKVQRFLGLEEFEGLRKAGLAKGFKAVLAGPLVRSSYRAGELLERHISLQG